MHGRPDQKKTPDDAEKRGGRLRDAQIDGAKANGSRPVE
jgi:hypothetical protein